MVKTLFKKAAGFRLIFIFFYFNYWVSLHECSKKKKKKLTVQIFHFYICTTSKLVCLYSYLPIVITTDISDFQIGRYRLWYRYSNCHIGRYRCRYRYIVNLIKCNLMEKNEFLFFVFVTCIWSTHSLKWFSDFIN